MKPFTDRLPLGRHIGRPLDIFRQNFGRKWKVGLLDSGKSRVLLRRQAALAPQPEAGRQLRAVAQHPHQQEVSRHGEGDD